MEQEPMSATRPWNSPDAEYASDMLELRRSRTGAAGGDGKRIEERILAKGKLERMRIIYKLLKENECVSGKELKHAIGESGRLTKLVYESINTLDDYIPIWQNEDEHNEKLVWFGLLDRDRVIPELEEEV